MLSAFIFSYACMFMCCIYIGGDEYTALYICTVYLYSRLYMCTIYVYTVVCFFFLDDHMHV